MRHLMPVEVLAHATSAVAGDAFGHCGQGRLGRASDPGECACRWIVRRATDAACVRSARCARALRRRRMSRASAHRACCMPRAAHPRRAVQVLAGQRRCMRRGRLPRRRLDGCAETSLSRPRPRAPSRRPSGNPPRHPPKARRRTPCPNGAVPHGLALPSQGLARWPSETLPSRRHPTPSHRPTLSTHSANPYRHYLSRIEGYRLCVSLFA